MSKILRVLKVRLNEEINGVDKKFEPGEIFIHPDDERAERLLAITPAIVKEPTDADYVEYAKFALKREVEVPDFVKERLREIEARKGLKKKAAPAPKKTAPKAGGAKAPEKDGDDE